MIRYARPADRPAIAEVVEAAFGQPAEARLVERLRDDGEVMFELVAEAEGQLCGHILYSRLWADSPALYAALAPLAVQPGLQNAGLGTELVHAGLRSARDFGTRGVLVLGHPAYYPRFGFRPDLAAKVSCPFSGSPSLMALELEPGAFAEPLTVAYASAFSA